MTIDHNALEASLDRFLDLDKEAEYMSRDALTKVAAEGPEKRNQGRAPSRPH